MKRGKSGVAIAVILVAAMLLTFALVACEKDDGCEHVNMRYVAAIDATCVEDGNVEFWYCPDCGKYYSDEMGEHAISIDDTVIAATGEHDWGAWVTDSESSCTTGGTRHRICNDCGERQEETLPVDKHDLNFVKAVEATCTEEGNVAHWHCSECGKNYSDEEATEVLNDVTTPKAAHDTTFVEAQAHTCTNDGNVAYWHCGSCDFNYADEDGEQELESVVDPAAHTWGEWEQTSDPTCTERGVLTRVCEVCFDEEYDYIDELGHDFEDAEWAYNDANHWHLCNRCGAASQRELHEYDAEGVCVCGMIEYAPTSEFRFISLGGDTWRLANYTGTRRNVSIPSTYNGGTVVAISDNAFAGNTSMETLVIPETVTSIGAEAFADCANLKNLTMSSKVTTIGDNAFDGCDAIETASIPANAASYISKGNLVDLTVTNGAIEEYAFASSPKLVSVEVVGETTAIEREAFSGCAVLASVEVDGQEVAIGDNAFVDCAMLTDVTFGDVASIGDFAFKDCAAIGEVVIPDSVTSIGDGAFSGCSGLTSMRLPFVGGSEQTTPSESTLFGYIFGTESYANSFETVQLYGVEEGQSVAYYIPRNLSTVSVGGDIGFGAFYGCDRLVDVTIEESEDVDAYAFYNNIALSHIVIPTTVTHIGEMAFAYCTALEEIEFPGTIKIVDKYAMSESAWYAAQPDGAVYIDKALYDYKGAFPEELQIKDGTHSVTSEAFLNAYALKSLVFPSSLEIFQDAAFDGCAVTDIVGKMEQISLFPKEAFERVTIIDSTSIPSSAFSGCESLTSITIPDSVTSIGYRAFYNCSGLTSITIPDSVTSIGDGAFYNCSGLTSITIPFVGEKADGTGSTSFDYIFTYDVPESLQEVIITGGESIADGAFEGLASLTTVTIPDTVTSLGDNVFEGCTSLEKIIFKGTIEQWKALESNSSDNDKLIVECADGRYRYRVTYDLDGGVNAASNPSSYTVLTLGGADGSMPLSEPSKVLVDYASNGDGSFEVTQNVYTFLGWYKDASFEQKVTSLTLDLGDVTLYAKWSEPVAQTETKQYVRVNKNNEGDAQGEYILFGEYPQTIKSSDVTVGDVADEDGYYLGSDGERYAKVVADPYNSGYNFSDGSKVTRGNTYYFKVEPIRWRILSESDGSAFILADGIIANHYYHHTTSSTTIEGETVYANNYKHSDIRAWLNGEFLNSAFGEVAQSLIETTEVYNTFDKVFLLGSGEVVNSEYGFSSNTARRMTVSDYARSTGAYMSTSSSYFGCGNWWLRSPYGNYRDRASIVELDGDAVANYDRDNSSSVSYDDNGVVPALNITL